MEICYLVSGQLQKNVTLMSGTPDPMIWLYNTVQFIPCFDSCQWTITGTAECPISKILADKADEANDHHVLRDVIVHMHAASPIDHEK